MNFVCILQKQKRDCLEQGEDLLKIKLSDDHITGIHFSAP